MEHIKEFIIRSIEEYLSILNKMQCPEADFKKLFYRGQPSKEFGLVPSIARNNYISFELQMIEEVTLEKPDDFYNLNFFNTLAKLQHYGLPTRLLDFTENPLVALYFACQTCENNTDDGEVIFIKRDEDNLTNSEDFIVNFISALSFCRDKNTDGISFKNFIESLIFRNPEFTLHFKGLIDEFMALNDKSIKRLYENILNVKLVIPSKTNERLIRQKGAFLLFPNVVEKLNPDINNDFIFKNNIEDVKVNIQKKMQCKIIIDAQRKIYILEQLRNIGIDRKFLFPDINSLCRYSKEKWMNKKAKNN